MASATVPESKSAAQEAGQKKKNKKKRKKNKGLDAFLDDASEIKAYNAA